MTTTEPEVGIGQAAADARAVRRVWVFGAVMAVLTVGYYLEPEHRLLTWSPMGAVAAFAVLVGIRWNRPAARLPWYLLAAAVVTLISGDTIYNVLTDVYHEVQPYPSVADAVYLLTYPLAAAGLLLMIRRRTPHRDLDALIDALILATGLGLLIWVFTVTPTVHDTTVPWTSSIVSIGYPLGDFLLLTVALRLLIGGGIGGWSARLLLLGVVGLTGSDIVYALVRLYGTWNVGSPADLGWVVFYASWGAAALHPSMRELTEQHRRKPEEATGHVLLLAMAALIAPGVLVVESLRQPVNDSLIIAVCSAVMFLLVLFRLALQGRELRKQEHLAHSRTLLRELRHRAYGDALTGLGNRLKFQERAARAVGRADQTGGAASMLLIDLDNFKEVNDTQGHTAGDELLIAAAGRLSAAVRPGDLAVRIGGDEFAVLLADGSPPAAACALAARLVTMFAAPFSIAGRTVEVKASIGVATSADAPLLPGDDGAEVLFRNADLALYAAKADGKATWRRFKPALYQAAMDRVRLRADLDRALERQEFVVHYQPIVDLRRRTRVAGFEALVRWNHPELGLVGPDDFIPLAEETRQIIPLGAWIMAQAIGDAARWNRASPVGQEVYIAVNVSAYQFLDAGLVESVGAVLSAAGLPPNLLVLEITETAFLHHHGADVATNLAALNALGVRVAIDDFGTGYSSIGYLRDMTVDILKIDKSFVDHITEEVEHEVLLTGIVHVAASLEVDIVAEGVETAGQRDLLTKMGCAYAQGYLFSPAVPSEQVPGLMAAFGTLAPEDQTKERI